MPYKDPHCLAAKESCSKSYKKWYNKRSNEYRLQRNANQRDYHRKNKEERNRKSKERNKKLNQKYRVQVLIHYGGDPPKCACCGESEFRFLTLDHINGGGSKQRREIFDGTKRKDRGGVPFYRWVKKNGFPEGFQVLCSNCNMAKGKSKKRFCPVHHPEEY